MYILDYHKTDDKWFLEKPSHVGEIAMDRLECHGSYCNFLEFASSGKAAITFYFDYKPFPGADICMRLQKNLDGALYTLTEFEGKAVNLHVQFNRAMLFFFNEFPKNIYIRKWSSRK